MRGCCPLGSISADLTIAQSDPSQRSRSGTRPVAPAGGGATAANLAPLSAAQLRAIAAAAARELTWGLPASASAVSRWRSRASRIPDAPIRHDALEALAHKRGHADGAALFAILPRRRDPNLLALLATYEIIWDFLDSVNERRGATGQANGKQLHLALVEALDPTRPISDYYLHHPWKDDGGYLRALVQECRSRCVRLRSYERVLPLLVREAHRAQVLAINHDLDPVRRNATLRNWAARELPAIAGLHWFELTSAASASLTIHVLFALGAEPACREADITRTYSAYFPWISILPTMLDSYVDQLEDAANGDHSYVAHYPTPEIAAQRICALIRRSLAEASRLPGGERHLVIVACMIALYLSKDCAWGRELRDTTERFICSGGSLTRILMPFLRCWRVTHAQRSS